MFVMIRKVSLLFILILSSWIVHKRLSILISFFTVFSTDNSNVLFISLCLTVNFAPKSRHQDVDIKTTPLTVHVHTINRSNFRVNCKMTKKLLLSAAENINTV